MNIDLPTRRCKLNRIGQQIRQHFGQFLAVEGKRNATLTGFEMERNLPRERVIAKGVGDFFGKAHKVTFRQMDVYLTGFLLMKIEQLIHQLQQPIRIGRNES